ncbi:MAG TPA: ATP-binding protein [Chryseosolibacter sp.]|nr:ATP-binding protein [Chryseosolibacter sp.]
MNRPQESQQFNSRQVLDLKKLVSQGEGLTLEFKRKAAHPEKIVREMIAFANTKGGILLVGVGDDKTIAGLKYPEGESHVIMQALKRCSPPLKITETFIPIGDSRTILLYEIPESKKKPHYQINGEEKFCFVRVKDQSITASREVKEIIRREQSKKDIQFYYGEHEQFLMQYLEKNRSITLKQFIELRGLKRSYASKKLVILVLADVLLVSPHERGDVFSLAPIMPLKGY